MPENGTVCYTSQDILDLVECLLSLAIIQVLGKHRALQGLDIPMGFSASVILLNVYMFKLEYLFVEKLVLENPKLAAQPHELSRCVG